MTTSEIKISEKLDADENQSFRMAQEYSLEGLETLIREAKQNVTKLNNRAYIVGAVAFIIAAIVATTSALGAPAYAAERLPILGLFLFFAGLVGAVVVGVALLVMDSNSVDARHTTCRQAYVYKLVAERLNARNGS